jgi:hypothetical protein
MSSLIYVLLEVCVRAELFSTYHTLRIRRRILHGTEIEVGCWNELLYFNSKKYDGVLFSRHIPFLFALTSLPPQPVVPRKWWVANSKI